VARHQRHRVIQADLEADGLLHVGCTSSTLDSMNAMSPACAGTRLAGVTVSVSGGEVLLPMRSDGIVTTPSRRGRNSTEYCTCIDVRPLTMLALRELECPLSSKSRCSGA
jgi:hypothetical protein